MWSKPLCQGKNPMPQRDYVLLKSDFPNRFFLCAEVDDTIEKTKTDILLEHLFCK